MRGRTRACAAVLAASVLLVGCAGGAGSEAPTGSDALPTEAISSPGPVPGTAGGTGASTPTGTGTATGIAKDTTVGTTSGRAAPGTGTGGRAGTRAGTTPTGAASSTAAGVTGTGSVDVRSALSRTVVTAADLPSGFAVPTSGKPADDPSGIATQRQLSACAGGSGSAAGQVGTAGSAYERTASDAYEEVSSLTVGFGTQARASALVTPLFGPDGRTCFDTYFRTTIEAAGYTVGSGSVTVSSGGVTPAVVGTVSARYTLSGGSGATTLSVDISYLVGRDLASIVSFYNLKAPVSIVLRDGVVATVSARIDALG